MVSTSAKGVTIDEKSMEVTQMNKLRRLIKITWRLFWVALVAVLAISFLNIDPWLDTLIYFLFITIAAFTTGLLVAHRLIRREGEENATSTKET